MIKKNILFSSISNIARLLLGILIFILLSRSLDLNTFGQYIYYIIITGYFAIFIDFGFNLSILNDLPRKPINVKNIFYEILYAKTILTFVSVILLLIFLYVMNKTEELNVFILFLFGSIVQSYTSMISSIFKAFNLFDKDFYSSLVSNIILLILIYTYKESLTLFTIGVFMLIGRSIALIYLMIMFSNQFSTYKVIGIINFSINILKKNFKYAVHMIIGGLFLSIDIPIMKEVLSYNDVAIYSAGMKIFVALVVMADVINSSFTPNLSKYIKKDYLSFEKLAHKLNTLLLIISLLLALIIEFFGKYFILLIYGEKYTDLIPLLPFFSFALIMRYLSFSYGTLVTISGKQYIRAILMVIIFIIHLILNITMQPNLGIKGAIIALCISFSLLLFSNAYIVYKEHRKLFLLKAMQ